MVENNDAFRDRLAAPFHRKDIDWRVGRCGKRRGSDEIWATCFAYATNRAIMLRLDDACGVGGWKVEFRHLPGHATAQDDPLDVGGFLCSLAIKIGDEWVTKEDGCGLTDIEPVKGGLSTAMKRAAVQWGIGRYLYDLPEAFAIITDDRNDYYGKTKDGTEFRWRPPALPEWALPRGETAVERDPEAPPAEDGGDQYPTQGEETQDPTREEPPARQQAQPPANERAIRDEIAALRKKLPEQTYGTILKRLGNTTLEKATVPQLKAVLNALRDNSLAHGGGR